MSGVCLWGLLNNCQNLVVVPYVGARKQDRKHRGVFKKVRPVLRPLEGKAAATWTGGAYEGAREHG